MDQKNLTFIVVSNHKGTTRKVVFPVAWIKAGVIGLVLAAFVGSMAAVDYVGLLVESVHMKKLKAESEQIRSQFQLIEGKLAALEQELERVRGFSQKLKLITNPDDPDRKLRLAIGPVTPPGKVIEELEVPMEDRAPASDVAESDVPFLDRPILDPTKDEIAREPSSRIANISIRIDRAVKDANLREQGILELWESLSGRQHLLRSTPSVVPARGWYTSRFGYRISPYSGRAVMHQGLDIAAGPGTPVKAPADGVVSYAGYDAGYGKLVSIDHGFGVVTRYGHNSRIYVTVGQKIRRGDLLSAVGNTGHSTGPHLHYEVRVNGVPVDPSNYILNE